MSLRKHMMEHKALAIGFCVVLAVACGWVRFLWLDSAHSTFLDSMHEQDRIRAQHTRKLQECIEQQKTLVGLVDFGIESDSSELSAIKARYSRTGKVTPPDMAEIDSILARAANRSAKRKE